MMKESAEKLTAKISKKISKYNEKASKWNYAPISWNSEKQVVEGGFYCRDNRDFYGFLDTFVWMYKNGYMEEDYDKIQKLAFRLKFGF